MYYTALREGLNSKSIMIPYDQPIDNYIKNKNKDYYTSLFYYNDDQLKEIEKNNYSVAGITDVVGSKLFWDFDSLEDLNKAKANTIELAKRLVADGFNQDLIKVYFSGQKGFSLEVLSHQSLLFNNNHFRNIVAYYAHDLTTWDRVVVNASRITRVVNTKHPESGLYKIPLELYELDELDITQILSLAKQPRDIKIETKTITKDLYEALLKLVPKKQETPSEININLDFSPASNKLGISNCRWSLLNGFFKEGERNNALLCLAATYKNLGYPLEITYRTLKGVAEIQAQRNNMSRFPDSELYNNIVMVVYSPNWKNGQYSCKDDFTWLSNYCKSLGEHSCSRDTKNKAVVELNTLFNKFKSYATNIDSNTIRTGIGEVDKRLRLIAGEHVGILGAPSSSKSSLALQILENTSVDGVNSLFFCMDMSDIVTIQKLYQKMSKKDSNKLYDIFKYNDIKEIETLNNQIKDKYKNVNFCFRNGLTIDNIRDIVTEEQKRLNGNLKLVVLDYAGRVMGPWSDPTSNGVVIASGLRSIANELGVCVLTLVQPPKSAGDARDELYSMRQIKGSSMMEESLDKLLGIFRPGFNPSNDGIDDKYLVMTVLKNRMGGLFTMHFKWDGLTGTINPLELHNETEDIQRLIENNKNRNKKDDNGGWG